MTIVKPAVATVTTFLLTLMLLLSSPAAFAAKVGSITLDESKTLGDFTLHYNGAGLRKKLFFKLYVGSLYLPENQVGASSQAIIEADEPMLIQLDILSELVTDDILIKAVNDGFKKSTGRNTGPIQAKIDQMTNAISEAVVPGHVYQLAYVPGIGTAFSLGEQTLTTIEGLDFKQALFGIWLSDQPIQESLKRGMLGG